MKKILIASPTFVLLAIIITGLVIPNPKPEMWNNLLVFATVGLIGYSFAAILLYGIALSSQGHANQKLADMPFGRKLLFTYLLTVLVITVATVIFLMAHN